MITAAAPLVQPIVHNLTFTMSYYNNYTFYTQKSVHYFDKLHYYIWYNCYQSTLHITDQSSGLLAPLQQRSERGGAGGGKRCSSTAAAKGGWGSHSRALNSEWQRCEKVRFEHAQLSAKCKCQLSTEHQSILRSMSVTTQQDLDGDFRFDTVLTTVLHSVQIEYSVYIHDRIELHTFFDFDFLLILE